MIICGNCQSKQLEGVIFCLECGASLMAERGYDPTRALDGVEPRPPAQARAVKRVAQVAGGPMVTLVMLASWRRITLSLADELLIGREDAGRSIHPEVDLGPEGGYDAGVSRRHAILALRDGVCTVEDLGSANGTMVNGRRLAPQSAVVVQSGDELTCGTLKMRVELG
ncbi:MAG: hypothetical protein RLZZ387_912 [Chloroflexota bacterium]|jgi:hypothetical protein